MRIAVLRADLQPIYLADLEQVSKADPAIEPLGQTRYVSRPSVTAMTAALAKYAPSGLVSTSNITFPLTLTGANNVLKLRTASTDTYTSVTVATGTYANKAALLTAMNTALAATPWLAGNSNVAPTSAVRIGIYTRAKGAGTRLETDSVGGGATANTPFGFTTVNASWTVPTGAAVILATVPVGGPAAIDSTTLRTTIGAGITVQDMQYIQDVVAPMFIETDVAIKSYLVGNLSKFASSSFNPDPSRRPALANGAAIAVLPDSGSGGLPYTVPNPTLGQANFGGNGSVRLSGSGLAGPGSPNTEVRGTKVKFLTVPNAKVLDQSAIIKAGGTVSSTQIIIPASLVPAGTAAGSKVQVQYTSLASPVVTLV